MRSRFTDVKKIVEKHDIWRYPNVVGYSNTIKKKIVRGREIDVPCIRIYVKKKLPREALRKDELIPEELDGVKTDVVEIGEIRAFQYVSRYRPAPCGVSTSRADEVAAGTIGWWVIDEDGNPYMISNNHVWAKENDGKCGDPILQPGRYDGGDPSKDVIAKLYDFIPIDFSGENRVDLAVAEPISIKDVYMSIMGVGGVTGKKDPVVGEDAIKIGRTTGLTKGCVSDESATLSVGYSKGYAKFTDVFIVEGFDICEPGDSGSPVLSSDGDFLGLLFAGSDDYSRLIACKGSNIETELTNKIGKKIWVLVANSYPPFKVEVITKVVEMVKTVYPAPYQLAVDAMANTLMFLGGASTIVSMLSVLSRAMNIFTRV